MKDDKAVIPGGNFVTQSYFIKKSKESTRGAGGFGLTPKRG